MSYPEARDTAFLEQDEAFFVPDPIDRALRFLIGNRGANGGWARTNSVPLDLHRTALVVEVLTRCKKFSGEVAEASYQTISEFAHKVEYLEVCGLSDLFRIVDSEATPHPDCMKSVKKQLKVRCLETLQRFETMSLRQKGAILERIGHVMSVDENFLSESEADFQKASESLAVLQHPEHGGWVPTGAVDSTAEAASPIFTAFAICALRYCRSGVCREARVKGLKYLETWLNDKGWDALGTADDNFATAIVLKALSNDSATLWLITRAGIDQLLRFQNVDGGWGGAQGEPSTVELTALVVLSLLDGGEARFVKFNAANFALTKAQETSHELSLSKQALERDGEEQVEKRIQGVIRERDKLRKDNAALSKKAEKWEHENTRQQVRISVLEGALAKAWRVSPYRIVLSDAYLRTIVAPVCGCVFALITATTGVFVASSRILSDTAALRDVSVLSSMLLAIAAACAFVYFAIRIRRSWDSVGRVYQREVFNVADVPKPSYMEAYEFVDIMRRAPRTIRDEIAYILSTEIADMPPEAGERYIGQVLGRLDVPQDVAREIETWMAKFLAKDRYERRVLVEVVRRVLHV